MGVYELQFGYQKLFSQGNAKDNLGNEVDSSTTSGIPLLNFNAGFSF